MGALYGVMRGYMGLIWGLGTFQNGGRFRGIVAFGLSKDKKIVRVGACRWSLYVGVLMRCTVYGEGFGLILCGAYGAYGAYGVYR